MYKNMFPLIKKWIIVVFTTFFSISYCLQFNENDIPELHYMDTSINPCDDFYKFTCGNFQNDLEPNNGSTIDNFILLGEELLKVGNEILKTPRESNEPKAVQKIKAAYQACINTNYSNQLLSPELQIANEFGGLPLEKNKKSSQLSWAEIGELVGTTGIPIFFSFRPFQFQIGDYQIMMMKDTTQIATKSSIPISTKSYDDILVEQLENVKKTTTNNTLLLETNRESSNHLKKLFNEIAKNVVSKGGELEDWRVKQIEKDVEDVTEFLQMSDGIIEEGVDVGQLNTLVTVADLQEWTDQHFGVDSNVDWLGYFQGIFKRSGMEITKDFQIYLLFSNNAKDIYGILNLIRKTNPEIVKNYIFLRTFLFLAPDSDYQTRTAFENYLKSLGYDVEERWEYCTKKLLDIDENNKPGLNYAALYQLQYYQFNHNKIIQAHEMLEAVKDTIRNSIINSNWMDEETIVPAINKLNNIISVIGWPDFVNNRTELDAFYENVRICEWDHYGNSRTVRAYRKAYELSMFVQKTRDFWTMSGFQVNAFYNNANNKILVPVSILYNIFFNGSNPIIDYSRLGTILSHEITHGFDTNGKKYDENGANNPWWSNATTEIYNQKSKCYEDQYNKYYVEEIDKYIDGAQTINENIADNGGFLEAFKTFQTIIKEQGLESNSEKYSLEQLFFISFGTMWCSKESVDYLSNLITNNEHSPARFRVQGIVSNLNEFSEAFNCPIDSRMNPKEKCSLW